MRQSIDRRRQPNCGAAPARPDGGASASVVVVRALAAAVASSGVDAADYLGRLGLGPEGLADVETRVPFPVIVRAWELAAEVTADPNLGLHLVDRVPKGSFDLLEYVTRSCVTYGDALRHLARYYRLIEDAAEITVEVDGEVARVLHRPVHPSAVIPRQGVEATVAIWVRRGRQLSGSFALHEAFFRHPEPRDTSEHRRIFRAPVRFGDPVSGIAFDRKWLDAPQPAADEGLRRVLDRQAEAMLARLPGAEHLRARAERAMVQLLPGTQIDLAALARSLGQSPRSLQRGLATEGLSFQALLALVRRDLASSYLADGGVPIAQISFLLGFSEPSAFQRAFRRWTGTTPLAYRRSPVRITPGVR